MENCSVFARHLISVSRKVSLSNAVKIRTLSKAAADLNHKKFESRVLVQRTTPIQLWSHLGMRVNRPSFFVRYCTANKATDQSEFELTFEDLQALIKSGDIRIIDVREPAELIEYGRYPNAVNIPLGRLQEALELSSKKFSETYGINELHTGDSNIVFCCLGGVRSLKALNIAKQLGFQKARHYKGGWEEYHEKMGLPFKQNPSS